MPVPSTPTNQYTQQGNAQVYISWDMMSGATSYKVQRSTDGITYTTVASGVTPPNYLDISVQVNTQYYYQIAATNVSGDSAYSSPQTIIPCLPGVICLANIRLQSQQRSDQLNGQFLTLPEWNQNITNSYKELYDLLLQKYGDDYYYTVPCSYLTTGQLDATYQAQVFPLPDGLTVVDSYNRVNFTGTSHTSTTIDSIASTVGLAVGQGLIGSGILPGTLIKTVSANSITLTIPTNSSVIGSIQAGTVVPSFYKLMLVEVALNPSDPNSWVTLKKYQRIQQNLWNFPNVYTFYGITNLRYRITGSQLQLVPISAQGQTVRIHYAPRPRDLIQDTDVIEGISGWEEYVIVDAAIKAMAKEESDPSELVREKMQLMQRIEAAAENRDVGEPECVSDSKTRNFAWTDSGGEFGGGSGMW